VRAEFTNEIPRVLDNEQERQPVAQALRALQSRLGETLPVRIAGREELRQQFTPSTDPADPDRVLVRAARGTTEDARHAVEAAARAYEDWSRVDPEARARCLFKAAAIMRRRKDELVAMLSLEVGKAWGEGDGEVCEAIDMLEYYGREMLRLAGHQPLTRFANEDNELYYLPIGVGVIIPPWNFPLSLLTGMSSAALVTGNSVVIKPASTAPWVAWTYCNILQEAGIPPEVVQFVPGSGAELGDALATHPLTRFIAFTGSKEVGLRLFELAGRTSPGQTFLRRVTAELGGKNGLIVDEGADYEAAAQGIVESAFSYQGQKCSAGSRAILVGAAYRAVAERVIARASELRALAPTDPACVVGPLIDRHAQERVQGYVTAGRQRYEMPVGDSPLPATGHFVAPTVFANVRPDDPLAQEEIFGPVLTLIQARDFDEAIAIANGTDYALTGSVYSNNRQHLEQARRTFRVGNLYFNRKSTGAYMGVHPFGGMRLSGTNSKSGGPDYLKLFCETQVVSEVL
jgi:1-pyrroline-5-carboxylate dehydrogenase